MTFPKKNPPQPRVVPTWFLNEAVRVWQTVIKEGDSKKIFFKSLFVVAGASSDKALELDAVFRENANFRGDFLFLPFGSNFIVKNQSQGHSPSSIEIPNL